MYLSLTSLQSWDGLYKSSAISSASSDDFRLISIVFRPSRRLVVFFFQSFFWIIRKSKLEKGRDRFLIERHFRQNPFGAREVHTHQFPPHGSLPYWYDRMKWVPRALIMCGPRFTNRYVRCSVPSGSWTTFRLYPFKSQQSSFISTLVIRSLASFTSLCTSGM